MARHVVEIDAGKGARPILYPVQRIPDQIDLTIHEKYTCDASGTLQVNISADPTGFTRKFLIGQPAAANGSKQSRRPARA